jgi:hypothetical protein
MRRSFIRLGIAVIVFAAALAVVLSLPGCQQLFTTSLAEPLARDAVDLPSTLTLDQAVSLVEEANVNNDSALAAALVDTLVGQVTDPAAEVELAAAAASAAITASGASDALMNAVSEALSSGNMDNIDAAALLAQIQAGATPNVLKALSYLDPDDGIADPNSVSETQLDATDYLIAAVVIAASALPEGADPTSLTPDELTAFQAKPEYDIAVDILTVAGTLVQSGSQAEDLLDQFSSMFNIS